MVGEFEIYARGLRDLSFSQQELAAPSLKQQALFRLQFHLLL
jgi:hypothetical protein